MDHGYQRLESDRYRLHFLIHEGKVARCGGFNSDDLEQVIEPAGSPDVNVCLMCALREAEEVFADSNQGQ
ncbi:hypothetical protein Caci_2950 [Catenulispora acidiphila DSM 44928]|uniref:Uncharacterized protein n=1 Tax=Catenulispora acidiphila (strain DSM 44928 / JCM 14897 / NBRC 102108 / NRRL B-24433 / ID139908) TaxID=479433 RepID=C7Q2W7_CATAD|nr:hypothetical protein [Catenulispora acidiphila]ACU71859.1 hypothetical protein Caci_2950 [Catenulispora acidiphila DSM 44928]